MKLEYPIRINKYLAHNNYATRLGADELIKKGLVFINGKKAILGDKVKENDKVTVNEKESKTNYVYYAYNKPVGITTNKDNQDDKNILEFTKFPTKVFPVGRLDKDSHGLIIMTNDGRITEKLLSPDRDHEKEYIVEINKNVTDSFLRAMANGVRFDGYDSKPAKVWRKKQNTFHIILTEGKKRQIRRMCEALFQKVVDLKRIRIMNIELGKIKPGEYKEIRNKELKDFLSSLKLI